MAQELTLLQAFNAGFKLFEIYYNEKGSGTIRASLGYSRLDPESGNISIMLGTMNFDTALWELWIESIDSILNQEGIKNHEYFTTLQAFKAIPLYLESFYGIDLFDDIVSLVADIRLIIQEGSTDSLLWKNWIRCVDEVLLAEDL